MGKHQSKQAGARTTPAELMRPRLILLMSTFVLVLLGILMIYSASSITALKEFNDPMHYLIDQSKFALIGIIAMLVASMIPYRMWATPAVWIVWLITTGLLIYTIAKGLVGGGAQRWVSVFGYTLQPTEFAKITSLLLMANILERYRKNKLGSQEFLILIALGVGLPLLLIFLQPDLGSTLIVLTTLLVLIYFAGFPIQYIITPIILGGIFTVVAIVSSEYRLSRFISAFNPWIDPDGGGYQVIQGYYAFAAGGLSGVGLGNSRQKFFYLPEAHTDFIFAIIGEELGLLGTLFVIILFGLFIYSCIVIALQSNDFLGKMIVAGISSMIAIQAIINIFCVIGFFPVTGKPLPFLSYGGSSLISSLSMVGLILSVSRNTELSPEAHRRRESFELIETKHRDASYLDTRNNLPRGQVVDFPFNESYQRSNRRRTQRSRKR
ncbi:MAG: putative lipid II flippase FtsW [Coriobacteriia bacterium]|nr:putative lipid II flippase FtsW [Coriobacteriia bacterium]